jgi:acetoin utilization protein AcuB
MSKSEVSEILSKPLLSTGPNELVFEAARVMVQNGIRHLPVVSEGRLVGILSARDVPKALKNPHLPWLEMELREDDFYPNRCVQHYMNGPVESIDRSATLREAAARLLERRIGSLVVTEKGQPMGIVTTDDLLRAIVDAPIKSRGLRPRLRALLDRWTLGILRSPVGLLVEEFQSSGI